jgi:hypothetical protein
MLKFAIISKSGCGSERLVEKFISVFKATSGNDTECISLNIREPITKFIQEYLPPDSTDIDMLIAEHSLGDHLKKMKDAELHYVKNAILKKVPTEAKCLIVFNIYDLETIKFLVKEGFIMCAIVLEEPQRLKYQHSILNDYEHITDTTIKQFFESPEVPTDLEFQCYVNLKDVDEKSITMEVLKLFTYIYKI